MTINLTDYPLLAKIDTPHDLRMLDKSQLIQASEELRRYLLNSVSKSSGHFASGLGTIELTVALHYVYNTPFDHLIWDVGHQAYHIKSLQEDEISYIP
jgi:1-deoxy-D-xylulose-5-phosphate synthase